VQNASCKTEPTRASDFFLTGPSTHKKSCGAVNGDISYARMAYCIMAAAAGRLDVRFVAPLYISNAIILTAIHLILHSE